MQPTESFVCHAKMASLFYSRLVRLAQKARENKNALVVSYLNIVEARKLSTRRSKLFHCNVLIASIASYYHEYVSLEEAYA